MYVPLKAAASQKSDFDVVAKISQIFEMDEYTNELRLRDVSGVTSFVLALKLKFPHLRQGDVVRIRSATYDETSPNKKVLLLSHYSNILTFVSSSKLAKDVKAKVSDEKIEKPKGDLNLSATVLTEVDKKHANLRVHSLNDLFHHADSNKELAEGTTFRTQFFVTKIESADTKEWTKAYDKKTKKTTSLKGSAATKSSGNLIYQLQLLVKDASTLNNANTYRILLYTHEGLGANFFNGLAADNLYKSKDSLKKLEEYASVLTKFNSFVDAVVERRNGFYFIKDTKIAF
jgi:hypothetical protein